MTSEATSSSFPINSGNERPFIELFDNNETVSLTYRLFPELSIHLLHNRRVNVVVVLAGVISCRQCAMSNGSPDISHAGRKQSKWFQTPYVDLWILIEYLCA
jgi:hypothetical protein